MRELLHGETARVEFTVENGPADTLPTASCYAGTTLLGAATVTALGGVDNYSITYSLPGSGITPYTTISFRLSFAVGSVSQPTRTLIAGELVDARRTNVTPPTVDAVADEVQTRTIARVTIVDECTTNTDMRGTDNALTTLGTNAPADWLNAAAIAASAMDNKGNWNIGKTGYALTTDEHDAIAVEVESHLLDEGDSQMLINAIVGAIGNTNIDEVVLVAAIRADLERSGGNLNTLITRIAANIRSAADDVIAETAQTTAIRLGLATSQNVLDSQSVITAAIDGITVELSPENIEEISDAVSAAVGEGLVEEIEREEGLLNTLNNSFNTVFTGIRYLAEWIRK